MPGGIRQDVLEGAVWEAAVTTLLNPEHVQAEVERRRREASGTGTAAAKRLGEIELALKDIERKIGILLDQLLSDSFPKSVIDQRKGRAAFTASRIAS